MTAAEFAASRAALRQQAAAARLALPVAAREQASARICEHVLRAIAASDARAVGLYWPMLTQGEVDTRALDSALEARGIKRYYPFMAGPSGSSVPLGKPDLGLRELTADGLWPSGRHGLLQPRTGAIATQGTLSWIVVPAVASTIDDYRLGYGSGFYDRVLPSLRPPAQAIIVAFDVQRVEHLPAAPHDVRCDAVVTESGYFPAPA
jgi:5-formyltetrahydrofolate cyclo-ligase